MGNEKKVLIIDDDARNIFALSAVLKSKGFVCISALDAQEGIGLMQRERGICAVLLDIMMPGMDGYEMLAVIRSLPAIANIPVIAVTAQAMLGDREKAIEAGADAYISKPVDIDILLKLLAAYT